MPDAVVQRRAAALFVRERPRGAVRYAAAVSALGYDAYMVILDAITRAKSADPQKIREALTQTKNFEGSAGSITINAERNADKDAVFKTVKVGKFVFLTTVKP